jgi:protein-tyrosine phosphatase
MNVDDFVNTLNHTYEKASSHKYLTTVELFDKGLLVRMSKRPWYIQKMIGYEDIRTNKNIEIINEYFKLMTQEIEHNMYTSFTEPANYSQITTDLYTGGYINDRKMLKELVSFGITHIIDCMAEHDDGSMIKAYNKSNPSKCLSYLWNGTEDDGCGKPKEWYDKGIKFALDAIRTHSLDINHPAKIYIHCAAGINRGPSMCYAVMRALNVSAEDAYLCIRHQRPIAAVSYRHDAEIKLKELGWIS